MTLWSLSDLDKIIEKFKNNRIFGYSSKEGDEYHEYSLFYIILNRTDGRGYILNKNGKRYSHNEFARLNNMKIFW